MSSAALGVSSIPVGTTYSFVEFQVEALYFILFYSTNVLSSCFVDRFRCGGGCFSTVHVVSSS